MLQLHQTVHLFHRIRRRLCLYILHWFQLLVAMNAATISMETTSATHRDPTLWEWVREESRKIRCRAGWILVTCWNLLSKSGIWGLGAFICPKSPFVQSHWLCFFVHQLAKIHPIKLLVRDLRNSRILNSCYSLFMWTLHCMLYVRKLPWKCITGTAVIHVWFEKNNLKTNIKADGAFESSR